MDGPRARAAVVTGGGRGIGRGICLALAEAGFDLVVGWTKGADKAAETVAEAQRLGVRAHAVQGDVGDPLTSVRLAECAQEAFGQLDCWVNNAGILIAGPLLELTTDDVSRSFEVNFFGTFHGVQAAARAMIAAGTGGRIINVSSEAGLRAWPLYGAYAPTKFAQLGLTQVAAQELGRHGILVNAVCPGLIETDMVAAKWPLEAALTGRTVEEIRAGSVADTLTGRLCTPTDVGATVAWLAGSGAANITGQSICVNAGVTLH
jgi:NAD(P)-dependent dehydrogenase (short-subunit alcohol dehydrogenase family)